MTIIVALGDSTTAGTPGFLSPVEAPPDGEGDERSQYPYWLMQARPDWRVLNRGVNGERSDEIAQRFTRDVLAHEPSAAIVLAGVNDVYQGRSPEDVTPVLDAMYRLATQGGIHVVAATVVPFNTATPAQNDAMHAINAWIAERASADPLVWCCDTRAAVARPGLPDMLDSSPDGLHPCADGYRRMAAALEPVVARALESACFET